MAVAPSVRAREREVIVGVVLPLTGSAAAWGAGAWNGLRVACEGTRLVPRVGDTEGRAELAARHATRLVRGGAVALVGAAQSVSALVAGDVSERAGIPLLTTTDLDPLLTARGHRFTFRAIPGLPALARALLSAARAEASRAGRPSRRLALLSERSVLGEAALEAARAEAAGAGLEVVDARAYDPAALDVAASLARWRAAGADIVAGYHPARALAGLVQALGESGPRPAVLAWLGPEPPSLDARPSAGVPVLASALWAPEVPLATLPELAARYRALSGSALGTAGAVGLSVGALLADALRRAPAAEGPALRDALAATELRAGQGTYVLLRGARFLPGGENAWAEGVVQVWGADGWRLRTA